MAKRSKRASPRVAGQGRKQFAELYDLLEKAMPLLRDVLSVREVGGNAEVREVALHYTASSGEHENHLHIERYRRTRNWALYDGEELVAVTVYKRGAEAVLKRLQAQERRIIELAGGVEATKSNAVERVMAQRGTDTERER